MQSSNGLEEVVYEGDRDPPLELGKPLTLCRPRQPPVSFDPVCIWIGCTTEWYRHFVHHNMIFERNKNIPFRIHIHYKCGMKW